MKSAARSSARDVVAAGAIAGLVFAAFEMLASAALMGSHALFMPLRMIGAILLGPTALDPDSSLVAASVAGVALHMVLSVAFAFGFAALAPGGMSTGGLLILGVVFGVSLWVLNFYVIAPLMGWRWFPDQTDPMVQLLAHGVFFGLPVAWYIARSRPALAVVDAEVGARAHL